MKVGRVRKEVKVYLQMKKTVQVAKPNIKVGGEIIPNNKKSSTSKQGKSQLSKANFKIKRVKAFMLRTVAVYIYALSVASCLLYIFFPNNKEPNIDIL